MRDIAERGQRGGCAASPTVIEVNGVPETDVSAWREDLGDWLRQKFGCPDPGAQAAELDSRWTLAAMEERRGPPPLQAELMMIGTKWSSWSYLEVVSRTHGEAQIGSQLSRLDSNTNRSSLSF